MSRRFARRAARFGAWAVLAAMAFGLTRAPSLAANLAPPTLTAWQRALEGHLTIEWTAPVRVGQKRVGDRLVLRFSEPLGTNAASALGNLSNFIDPRRTTVQGKDLSLALKPGVHSKVSLREKRIVAVDVFRDEEAPPAPRIEATAIDGGIRLTMDWPGPTRIASEHDLSELRLTISPAQAFDPIDLADLQRKLGPWFSGLGALPTDDGATALSFVLEPQVTPSVRSLGPSTTIVDLIRDASATPLPAAGPPNHLFIPERRPQIRTTATARANEARPPIPKKRPLPSTRIATAADIDHAAADRAEAHDDRPEALVIAWDEPVGAAVFVRAGHLWAVFDQPDAGLLSALPSPPAAFGPATIVPADGGTALRFPLIEPVDVAVDKTADGQWRIAPKAPSPPPRSPEVARDERSETLRISPARGERIVGVVDPAVGDRIDVLPMRDQGIGQSDARRFVDLELLPTVQGVVWRPLNDRLVAEVGRDDLIISSPEGLSLSAVGAGPAKPSSSRVIETAAKRKTGRDDPPAPLVEKPAIRLAEPNESEPANIPKPSSYLDLADTGVDRSLVGEYRRIKRQAIAKIAPTERDEARIDLARLLVAERLAIEARTVLNTISNEADEDIALQKKALSGAAAFLIGHLDEASTLLLAPDLDEDDELDIWRAALASAEDRWQTAAGHWRAASGILDSYPPRLKFDFGLMALQAAIETNDDGMIRKGFRRLTSMPLDPYDQARLDAMEVLNAERAGDLEKARALLAGLTESPNPAIRTLADFQLAALDLKTTGGDPQQLAPLDRLMPLWRGHPDERSMLDELASRHRDVNALRRALTIWQRLIRLYPELADDVELSTTRREAFMQALANVAEPSIPLHDVYAIYLDFNDLVPDEPEAQTVHRQLAQHLSDLDLLDQAIDVLRPLMTSAEDDLTRAELAATVATLMLSLDRPAPALAFLDSTDSTGRSSAAFDRERRLIGARALARLGRTEEALRRLRDLRSKPANRLQAEILWDERDWPRLASVIDSYFADTDLTSPVAEEDQELVLWLALARQRIGASDQLATLRERFRPSLQGSPYLAAFDVATQGSIRANDIPSLLAATEKQLAELQRFRQDQRASP